MKQEPKILVTLNTAAGRLQMAPQTLKRRLIKLNEQPDFAILNGGRPLTLCWSVDSLPRLRKVLDLNQVIA